MKVHSHTGLVLVLTTNNHTTTPSTSPVRRSPTSSLSCSPASASLHSFHYARTKGTKRQASDAAAPSKATKRRKRANDADYPSDLPSKKLTFDHCEWLEKHQTDYESRPLQGQIGAEDREVIDRIFAGCNDEVQETTEHGLWTKPEDSPLNTLPRVLPIFEPSNLTGTSYWLELWMDIAYFMALKAGLEFSRIGYLETWLADRLTSGPSFHEKSGTLVLANAGAVVAGLGVELGAPIPASYDPCRLGLGNYEHALEWAKTWTGAIKSTMIILEPSQTERWQPADFESESQPLAESNHLESVSDESPVASGSGPRRKSKLSLNHESDDDDDMDRLDAQAESAWGEKSSSESEDWEGSKASETAGSESDSSKSDSEPIVGKGKAPARGEKAPAKAGGGSSRTKDEPLAKTRAKTLDKTNVNHSVLLQKKLDFYRQHYGIIYLAKIWPVSLLVTVIQLFFRSD
ncbi:hypothetical protein FRC08_011646 [Ceratobasidium sp. 394]|nr:hypothetical protein FRC08_011646 [Ceratobasidium sp. 394]KAG9096009.1 hypothetical protein FS749_009272 [Ceratobasidium sp. UAMH 11750]